MGETALSGDTVIERARAASEEERLRVPSIYFISRDQKPQQTQPIRFFAYLKRYYIKKNNEAYSATYWWKRLCVLDTKDNTITVYKSCSGWLIRSRKGGTFGKTTKMSE